MPSTLFLALALLLGQHQAIRADYQVQLPQNEKPPPPPRPRPQPEQAVPLPNNLPKDLPPPLEAASPDPAEVAAIQNDQADIYVESEVLDVSEKWISLGGRSIRVREQIIRETSFSNPDGPKLVTYRTEIEEIPSVPALVSYSAETEEVPSTPSFLSYSTEIEEVLSTPVFASYQTEIEEIPTAPGIQYVPSFETAPTSALFESILPKQPEESEEPEEPEEPFLYVESSLSKKSVNIGLPDWLQPRAVADDGIIDYEDDIIPVELDEPELRLFDESDTGTAWNYVDDIVQADIWADLHYQPSDSSATYLFDEYMRRRLK